MKYDELIGQYGLSQEIFGIAGATTSAEGGAVQPKQAPDFPGFLQAPWAARDTDNPSTSSDSGVDAQGGQDGQMGDSGDQPDLEEEEPDRWARQDEEEVPF